MSYGILKHREQHDLKEKNSILLNIGNVSIFASMMLRSSAISKDNIRLLSYVPITFDDKISPPAPHFLSHCSQQSFQFAFLHRHDFATLNVMPGKLILLKNPIRILNITKKGGCSSVYFCQGHVCIAKKFNFRLTLQKNRSKYTNEKSR